MELKRKITVAVVGAIILGWVVTIFLNIASSRIDDHLVESRGSGYPMQFLLTAVGWQYLPHLIALVGVAALWWWSQSAPPPEVRTVIEYRDPPPPLPPIRVPMGDAEWEDRHNSVARGTPPAAFCAKHPHIELQFYSHYGNGIARTEPIGGIYPRGAFSTSPWCVECAESVNVGDDDYFNAQRIAKTKIDGERRRRAGDLG